MRRQADKIDVQKRIERSRLPDRQRQELLDDIEHLDNRDAWKIYPESVREKDFNTETCLSKKRCFDVDWTAHGAYRSELRDRDPEMVNEDVSKFIFNRHFDPKNKKRKPPKKDELRFKGRGGPVVIDYDAKKSPIDVNIVTTYPKGASEMNNKQIASELVKIAKLVSSAVGKKVGKYTVEKYKSQGSSQMFIVKEGDEVLGYIEKFKDTRTETNPWKAFHYTGGFVPGKSKGKLIASFWKSMDGIEDGAAHKSKAGDWKDAVIAAATGRP